MTTTSVGLRRSFTVVHTNNPEQFEAHAGALMEALLALEGSSEISGSAVSLDMDANSVEIEVVGNGPTFEEAVAAADSCIRSAIHSAGGSTPEWVLVTISEHNERVVTPV